MKQITILGAGISGLSLSYHVGHENCVIYEAEMHYGGHAHSEIRNGFTWDHGPHANFGPHEYVKELYAQSEEMLDSELILSNYFHGTFITHPAQSNLYQIPEPLRSACLESFLKTRNDGDHAVEPTNYREWLHQTFGPVFAETFPCAYTRKYWASDPANLGTDWMEFPDATFPRRSKIGHQTRIFRPNVDDVVEGSRGPLNRPTHYTNTLRYPARGGFVAFLRKLAHAAQINYGRTLFRIDFGKRELTFLDGSQASYDLLVSTIPLPALIGAAIDAPARVREAAGALHATSILLVEITASHPARRPETYFYVYDEDKLCTRVSIIEHFSPNNAPAGKTGVAAEVYWSPAYRPVPDDREAVGLKVQHELVEMGVLDGLETVESVNVRHIPYAQVIFDHSRKAALECVNAFLDDCGIQRLGRYAEWDYLMTHDSVMGSRQMAEDLRPRIR